MTDPKPWLLDPAAPEGVRVLLEGAHADGPSAEQLERLAARVAPAVGVAATALVVQAAMPPVAPLDPGAFAVGKAALAGAGKLTAAWFKAAIAASVIGVAGYGAVRLMPQADHGARARPVAQREPAPSPVESAPPVAQKAAPADVAEVVPSAEAVVEPPSAREAGTKQAQPPSEIALMKAAQDAHATPARALALLQKHARLYPDGMFAQEREVLAISALLTLGRRPEAQARAQRMAAAYPGSAHLRRVRVLLDGPETR